MRVLSFDPGGCTGWCCMDKQDDKKMPGILVDRGDFKGWDHVEDLMLSLIPDVVTYEVFRLYATKAQSKAWDTFLVCEVIGVIKFLCRRYGTEIVEQTPAQGKQFFNTDKMKKLGLYQSVTHINDATGHALYYLKFGKTGGT